MATKHRRNTMAFALAYCAAVLLSLFWKAAATTTNVRVALPDIAGMLYPQQTQRIQRFGTSPTNVVPFYATRLPLDGSLPPCTSGQALCLEVVWASAFEFDPFTLVSFASKYNVASSTFDGLLVPSDITMTTPGAATVRPVIEGSADVTSSANPSANDPKTLWRFSAMPGPGVVDLLFRLRQQSQLRSARDQLLVHVAATLVDPRTSSASVETFAVYGNQRVRHKTTRVSANQMRVDITLLRNSSITDVVLQDSYPLVPVQVGFPSGATTDMWRITDAECLHWSSVLLECGQPDDLNTGVCSYESSTALIPSCLRTTYSLTTDSFKSLLTNEINQAFPLYDQLQHCFSTGLLQDHSQGVDTPIYQRVWWSASVALRQLASRQCPFGPLNGVLSTTTQPNVVTKMLQLVDITPISFTLWLNDAATFSGHFRLVFSSVDGTVSLSAVTSNVTDSSSPMEIATAVATTLQLNAQDVLVTKVFEDATLAWVIGIQISNFVSPPFGIVFEWTDNLSSPIQLMDESGSVSMKIAPLNPLQLSFTNLCDTCALELEACQADDTCRLVVLPCVEQQFAALSVANAQVDAVYGTHLVDFLSTVYSVCFANAAVPSWNPVRRALMCFNRYQCRVNNGTLDNTATGSNTDEQSVVRLKNGTQVIAVPLDTSQGGTPSTTFALTISNPSATFQFHGAVDQLAVFLQTFVLGNAATVVVELQEYPLDASLIQLRIVYMNSLSPNPTFTGTVGLVAIENIPATGYIEVGDIAAFSVNQILTVIRSFMAPRAMAATIPASATNHGWQLSSECLACTANLYGCSTADVFERVCLYDNATSLLAQCIRERFPRERLVNMTSESSQQHLNEVISVVVTTDLTRCMQQTDALTGGTIEARVAMMSAVGCFSRYHCPFGPVDLVQDDRMLQLTTSSYIHTIRVYSKRYSLPLVFKMGQYIIGSVTITNDNDASVAITQALSSVEFITVQAEVEGSLAIGEWTLTLRYGNYVGSDFGVSIAPSSFPPLALIEQHFWRPTTRLYVSPRETSMVFVTPATTETPSTSPPAVELVAECNHCDAIHLAACGRSTYCRSVLAPLIVGALRYYSFADLAQTVTVGTTTTRQVDLAKLLSDLVQQSGWSLAKPLFIDWWEPLQQWLGCYAANMCPLAWDNSAGKSYLSFTPASIKVQTMVQDIFTQSDAGLDVLAPTGSSLRQSLNTVRTQQELADFLSYMTQKISASVTIEASVTNEGDGVLVAQYESPFLGDLPSVTISSGLIRSVVATRATLKVLTTSTVQGVDPSWNALADKLDQLSAGSSPPTCSECETIFLSQCQALSSCQGYLLDCVQFSLENHFETSFSTDRSMYQVLMGCSRTLETTEWLPLQQYFVCVRDSQCTTNSESDGSPASYVRLQSGGIRLPFMSTTPQFSATIVRGDNDQDPPYPFTGTVNDLHTYLQAVIGTAATVEMRTHGVWQGGNRAIPVEFIFHGYLSLLPLVIIDGTVLQPWLPQVIVYSSGVSDATTTALSTALATYMVVPQCSGICESHLDDCARSDSYDSLVCRQRTLPCVASLLNGDLVNLGVLSNSGTQVAFTDLLRSCENPSIKAFAPITKYLSCFAHSGCSLTVPRSIATNTELIITQGQQDLRGIDPFAATFWLDGIGESATVSTAEDVDVTAWRLRTAVLGSIGSAEVYKMFLSGGYTRLRIAYGNVLGGLPSITNMTDGTLIDLQTPPAIAIKSTGPIVGSHWERLQTPISARTVDTTNQCNSCLIDAFMNCPLCEATLVPSLLAAIGSDVGPLATAAKVDLSTVLYTVVDTISVNEWQPLANLFRCYMRHGCVVSPADDPAANTSYVIVEPAKIMLQIPDLTQQTIQLMPPTAPSHSIDASTATAATPVDVLVNKETQYSELLQTISDMLDKNGQSPTITVRERDIDPRSGQLVLEITIRDFVGWLPTVVMVSGVLGSSLAPQLYAQTLNNGPSVSIQSLTTNLRSYEPAPSPSPLVATNTCAQCAAALYECDLTAITSGMCTYTTSTSAMVVCLRQKLTPSVFYGVAQTHNTTYAVNTALSQCFATLQLTDPNMGDATFKDDLWSLANEHLACFDMFGCAFGPLSQSVTSENMIQLYSPPVTKTFRVYATSFSAIFQTKFGVRELESASFTEASSEGDLATLLMAILPESETTVTKTLLATADGYDLSVTHKYIYFTDFELHLVVDGGSTSVEDQTPDARLVTALKTVVLDMTNLGNANTA